MLLSLDALVKAKFMIVSFDLRHQFRNFVDFFGFNLRCWSCLSTAILPLWVVWPSRSEISEGSTISHRIDQQVWCRVLGSTSPLNSSARVQPIHKVIRGRQGKFWASTFWRLHWGVELQFSLVFVFWRRSTDLGLQPCHLRSLPDRIR